MASAGILFGALASLRTTLNGIEIQTRDERRRSNIARAVAMMNPPLLPRDRLQTLYRGGHARVAGTVEVFNQKENVVTTKGLPSAGWSTVVASRLGSGHRLNVSRARSSGGR